MTRIARLLTLLIAATLFSCAGLKPGFEEPTVGISSFRLIPSERFAPQFEIGLHIVNPNRTPLPLEGIVYSVNLNGYKILTGATNKLPVIEGYSEGDVTLRATPDLLSSVSILRTLLSQAQDTLTYELDANLDIGGMRPRIHLQEKGKVSLRGVEKHGD
jgi:LEA14-like dessication related protein